MRPGAKLLLAFSLLALPAAAGLIAGPERAVAPPVYGPAFGAQYLSAVATDGDDFLAVWSERSPGRDGVYAAVVTESLEVRSVPSRPVVLGHNLSAFGAVPTGDGYLLFLLQDGDTVVARLSSEGALEGQPATVAPRARAMGMAWNGTNVLLAVTRNDGARVAMLLDRDGRVVRDDIVIPVRGDTNGLAVAAAGDVFVLAWNDVTWGESSNATTYTIRTMRVFATGDVSTPHDVTVARRGSPPALRLVASGSEAGLATLGDGELALWTIDAQLGAVSAPVAMRANASAVELVPTSRGFAAGLLANDSDGATLVIIPFSGGPRTSLPIAPAEGMGLRLASNGRSIVAMWQDRRLTPRSESPKWQIFGVALDAAAERLTSAVAAVATSPVGQADPIIAPAGDDALVVWQDLTHTSGGELVAVRIDAAGNPHGQPVVLAHEEWRTSAPAAVFTGELWLVAWSVTYYIRDEDGGITSRSDMKVARIARDGTLIDREPLAIGGGVWPVLASNGTTTVLAFGSSVIRFSRAGERIDDEPLRTRATGLHLSLAANAHGELLLAWTSGDDWWQFPAPNRHDVQAMRLDAAGVPIDAPPIDVATSSETELMPQVVSDGTDFLVVYQQGGTFEQNVTIRAKRVLRSGVLADTTAGQHGTVVAEGNEPFRAAPYRGGYVVAFATPARDALSMVTVDRDGKPGSAPRPIVAMPVDDFGSVALASSGETIRLAYTRPDASLQNVPRVFVRRLFEAVRRRAVR